MARRLLSATARNVHGWASMAITRRQFIKIGGGAVGAAAVGSGLVTEWWGLDRYALADPGTDGDEVVATFCELCFWKCGLLAHRRDGRVTKLVGNPDHPLSRGKLCPRGVGGTGLLYDPDRLKQPLVRVSRRGEDAFVPVSWDDALDRVAEGLDRVRTEHGPEALALFSHGCGWSWFKQLGLAYGSPNLTAPSYAQCRGPREEGYRLVFGSALGSPEAIDIENARCLTLIGSHLGANMHNTQVQELADAVGKGLDLVVVDPRYSLAASKARFWLPIKLGTDIALLLAWMHVIIGERLYDVDYVRAHANGFAELAAHVADKTPEWAYVRTGLSASLIRDSARLIASHRPASLIHPGRRTVWYGDDTYRAQAMAILAALLGSWGRRGGYVVPSQMALPPFPTPPLPRITALPADQPAEGGYPLANEVLASGLRDASVPGTAAYDIKGWLVYGTNLIQTLPEPQRTLEALQHLDFVVSIDVLPAEICGWSDVVLPECTYLERHEDLWAASYKEPFIALRQPVVEPMYDSKPGWWIARELGRRLGLGAWMPWESAEEVIEVRARAAGLDLDALWARGVIVGEAAPTCEEDGLPLAFETPSGKIELASPLLAEMGLSPLPVFTPPEEPPPGYFRLLSGRSPLHTFGRTANNRVLGELEGENEVWVQAAVAAALPGFEERPLQTGELVVLINQDGVRSAPVKARVTQRIRGDCVYLVHGFGHTARGLSFARGRGASLSELTTRSARDPLMGGTALNLNFVRLERPAAVRAEVRT
jgi:thiosulfate reductase / polysulfide reductase chain A